MAENIYFNRKPAVSKIQRKGATVYERIFENIRIFKYFPPNIDIHIRFVAIFKAESSNIFVRIFPNNVL